MSREEIWHELDERARLMNPCSPVDFIGFGLRDDWINGWLRNSCVM